MTFNPPTSPVVSFVIGLIAGVLLTLGSAFELRIGFTGAGVLAVIALLIALISFAVYMRSSDPLTIHRSQATMAFFIGIAAGYVATVQVAQRVIQ